MDFDVDGLSDGELAKLSKAVAERLQRRKVLAAGAGAAVGGSFLAGQETARADPQTTQSGTYGDGDEDWNVQDIDANHVASNSVTTEEQNLKTVYVSTGNFSGSDTHAAFNNARAEHGFSDVHFIVEYQPGESLSTAMDLTDKANGEPVVIDLRGNVTFTGSGDGIAFDITSSPNGLHIDTSDFRMLGGSGTPPDAAFFIARGSGGSNVGINTIVGRGLIGGSWNAAPFYNIGGEVWRVSCRFGNSLSSGRAAMLNDESNPDNLSSPNITSQGGGVTAMRFVTSGFRSGGADHSVYLGNTRDLAMVDCYFVGGTKNYINFNATNGSLSGPYYLLRGRGENGGNSPSEVIGATAPSSGSNNIQNLVMPNGSFSGSVTNFIDLPNRTFASSWQVGSATHGGSILRTNKDGIRFADAQSNVAFWGFINQEQTGAVTVPGNLILSRWMFHGNVTSLPKSAMDQCRIVDARNAVVQYVDREAKLELDWTTGDIITRASSVTTGATDSDFT
jgi:hypothetical protein